MEVHSLQTIVFRLYLNKSAFFKENALDSIQKQQMK